MGCLFICSKVIVELIDVLDTFRPVSMFFCRFATNNAQSGIGRRQVRVCGQEQCRSRLLQQQPLRASSSRTAAFRSSAGEHRCGARRIRQPHVCRFRLADAVREVAARHGGADTGGQRAGQQERPATDRRPRDGYLHVRRRVPAWPY